MEYRGRSIFSLLLPIRCLFVVWTCCGSGSSDLASFYSADSRWADWLHEQKQGSPVVAAPVLESPSLMRGDFLLGSSRQTWKGRQHVVVQQTAPPSREGLELVTPSYLRGDLRAQKDPGLVEEPRSTGSNMRGFFLVPLTVSTSTPKIIEPNLELLKKGGETANTPASTWTSSRRSESISELRSKSRFRPSTSRTIKAVNLKARQIFKRRRQNFVPTTFRPSEHLSLLAATLRTSTPLPSSSELTTVMNASTASVLGLSQNVTTVASVATSPTATSATAEMVTMTAKNATVTTEDENVELTFPKLMEETDWRSVPDGQYHEINPGQYQEEHPGQYHEINPGQYHEVNPGQYHEVNPGQYTETHGSELDVQVDVLDVTDDAKVYNVQSKVDKYIIGEYGTISKSSGQTLQGVRYTAVADSTSGVDPNLIYETLVKFFPMAARDVRKASKES